MQSYVSFLTDALTLCMYIVNSCFNSLTQTPFCNCILTLLAARHHNRWNWPGSSSNDHRKWSISITPWLWWVSKECMHIREWVHLPWNPWLTCPWGLSYGTVLYLSVNGTFMSLKSLVNVVFFQDSDIINIDVTVYLNVSSSLFSNVSFSIAASSSFYTMFTVKCRVEKMWVIMNYDVHLN